VVHEDFCLLLSGCPSLPEYSWLVLLGASICWLVEILNTNSR
jgi:hypothetical protein